jgi:hypothetical protein
MTDNQHPIVKLWSNSGRTVYPSSNARKVVMPRKKAASFDTETVSLLRATLDDAWASLRPEQRAITSQSILAEGILKLAAEGERNPKRLRDAALMAVAA